MAKRTARPKNPPVHIDTLELPDPGPVPADGMTGPMNGAVEAPPPAPEVGSESSEQREEAPEAANEKSYKPELRVFPQPGDRVWIDGRRNWGMGTVREIVEPDARGGTVVVVWDEDSSNGTDDEAGTCEDAADLEQVWEWVPAVGDRVRLADDYPSAGDLADDLDDEFTITAVSSDYEELSVRWDSGETGTYYHDDLVLVTPATVMASSEPSDDTPPEDIPSRWMKSQHTEMKTLFVSHGFEDVDAIEGNLADLCLELERIREEKRSADAGFNARIKAKEAKINKLAQAIADGGENTSVPCTWYYDHTNGMAELRRDDYGNVIESRPLSDQERQMQLAIDEDRHPDDQEGAVVEGTEEERSTDMLRCNGCTWIWQVDAMYTSAPAVRCPQCDSPAVSLEFEPGVPELAIGDHVQMEDANNERLDWEGDVVAIDGEAVTVRWVDGAETNVHVSQISRLIDVTDMPVDANEIEEATTDA